MSAFESKNKNIKWYDFELQEKVYVNVKSAYIAKNVKQKSQGSFRKEKNGFRGEGVLNNMSFTCRREKRSSVFSPLLNLF